MSPSPRKQKKNENEPRLKFFILKSNLTCNIECIRELEGLIVVSYEAYFSPFIWFTFS